MKLLRTEITPFINEPLYIDKREQPFLWSPFHSQPSFHAHPEMELVFVEEGFGKRIIGNQVEPFEAGDMVFIGSNVPHIWLSDPAFYEEGSTLKSKVIITYFNPTIFNQLLGSLKEFDQIRRMVQQAAKGIRIYGRTRNIIAEQLRSLSATSGFEKVNGMLQIMHLISTSHDKGYILPHAQARTNADNADKLVTAINFIKNNLDKPIYLQQAAALACMTESSFSRYFKQRMKKNFSTFLTELRIEKAKELFLQSDLSVKEVAYRCGYDSLAHFHKLFKDFTGLSPAKYKSDYHLFNPLHRAKD
ncbi:MAG: helix-turn-helix domain-containing protein [Parapedobacter sp.]|nr:MAG: helix-turn-helix domain-containing protein [Parapedobacter sp.]